VCVIVFDLYLLCVRIGEISHGSNRTHVPSYSYKILYTTCLVATHLFQMVATVTLFFTLALT